MHSNNLDEPVKDCAALSLLRIVEGLSGMLAIGWRWSIFSLTKSGKTKSCGLGFVSRTRLRKAGERRKRRGRSTNFLTDRGYAFGAGVASSP